MERHERRRARRLKSKRYTKLTGTVVHKTWLSDQRVRTRRSERPLARGKPMFHQAAVVLGAHRASRGRIFKSHLSQGTTVIGQKYKVQTTPNELESRRLFKLRFEGAEREVLKTTYFEKQ